MKDSVRYRALRFTDSNEGKKTSRFLSQAISIREVFTSI